MQFESAMHTGGKGNGGQHTHFMALSFPTSEKGYREAAMAPATANVNVPTAAYNNPFPFSLKASESE